MNLSIEFGALVPPLAQQLKGTSLRPGQIKHFQADADAICRLVVRGLLSPGQAHLVRKRLFKRITVAAQKEKP